jgi:lamin tail-like protein
MRIYISIMIAVVLAGLIAAPALQAQPYERPVLLNVHPCPVIINEVMFNPDGSDTTGEFIELYNTSSDEYVDLRNWTVSDLSGDTPDTLSSTGSYGAGGYEIPPKGFAIIVDQQGISDYADLLEDYAFSETYIVLYVDDNAIAGGLDNGGDETITIETDYETVMSQMSHYITAYKTLTYEYNSYIEGESFERDRYDTESWIQSPDPNGCTIAVINSWEE